MLQCQYIAGLKICGIDHCTASSFIYFGISNFVTIVITPNNGCHTILYFTKVQPLGC